MKTISYKKVITPTKIENPAAALAFLNSVVAVRSSLSSSAAELVPNNINNRNYEGGRGEVRKIKIHQTLQLYI